MPGVQRYLFAADISPQRIAQAVAGAFSNALSGDPVTAEIEWVDDLDPMDVEYNTVSLHPWQSRPRPRARSSWDRGWWT